MTQIAFIHPNYPTSEGTGATHSATQIINCLREPDDFDVTCFCLSTPVKVPDNQYKCEFILTQNTSIHTGHQLNNSILRYEERLSEYDVVHSYLPITIPALDKLGKKHDISTSVTLNAYKAICPKNDMMFLNEKKCGGNGIIKCTFCSAATDRCGFGLDNARKFGSKLGNLNLIRKINPKELQIDQFHALSPGIKQSYIKQGYQSSKIQEIPNLPDKSFNIEHRSDFQEPYDLLYVGYLKKNKGAHLLPQIVLRLKEVTDYEFHLTIAGSGEKEEHIKKALEKFEIKDSVTMLGHVSHEKLPDVYAKHDLLIYPGIWDEPFGRVLIESLATGTPIVGTKVGNVPEIIGNAGITTTADPTKIAESICSVFKNSRLIELHRQTKKEMEKYDPDDIREKFITYYNSF